MELPVVVSLLLPSAETCFGKGLNSLLSVSSTVVLASQIVQVDSSAAFIRIQRKSSFDSRITRSTSGPGEFLNIQF
jgi:hypothetical protein